MCWDVDTGVEHFGEGAALSRGLRILECWEEAGVMYKIVACTHNLTTISHRARTELCNPVGRQILDNRSCAGLACAVSEEHTKGPRWKPNDVSLHLIWNVQKQVLSDDEFEDLKTDLTFQGSQVSFFHTQFFLGGNGEALVYVSPFYVSVYAHM